LSHHAGSPGLQPFIAIVTTFGPSSKYPIITARSAPVRRPVVVSRAAPHLDTFFGRHNPTLPRVRRTNRRCANQKPRTTQRGGSHALVFDSFI
jgi:hypothetical protein